MNSKILIIEDNADIREIIRDLLELKGFNVVEAPDGPKGIRTAIRENPSLIICDIMMPIMDGFEVFLSLREIDQFKDVPFLFVTARTDSSFYREAMNLGADDYLTKPFAAEDLIEAVSTRIANYNRRNSGQSSKINEAGMFASCTEQINDITASTELLLKYGNDFSEGERTTLLENIYGRSLRMNKNLYNSRLYNLIDAKSPDEFFPDFFNGNNCVSVSETIKSLLGNKLFGTSKLPSFETVLERGGVDVPENAIVRIITELIDNALVHSDDKKIKIKGMNQNMQYRIEIINEGIPDSVEEINEFSPFIGQDSVSESGPGLGLFISKAIADYYSGQLLYETDHHETKAILLLPSMW